MSGAPKGPIEEISRIKLKQEEAVVSHHLGLVVLVVALLLGQASCQSPELANGQWMLSTNNNISP